MPSGVLFPPSGLLGPPSSVLHGTQFPGRSATGTPEEAGHAPATGTVLRNLPRPHPHLSSRGNRGRERQGLVPVWNPVLTSVPGSRYVGTREGWVDKTQRRGLRPVRERRPQKLCPRQTWLRVPVCQQCDGHWWRVRTGLVSVLRGLAGRWEGRLGTTQGRTSVQREGHTPSCSSWRMER